MYTIEVRLGLTISGQAHSDYALEAGSGGRTVVRLTEHGEARVREALATGARKGAMVLAEIVVPARVLLEGIEIASP